MKRIQSFHEPCMWGNHNPKDTGTYIYYFDPKTELQTITVESRPDRYKRHERLADPEANRKVLQTVWNDVCRAWKKGRPAIMFAYDETTKESSIVSVSEVGVYADMVRKYGGKIGKAQREVFPNGCPKIETLASIKEEPVVKTVLCVFDEDAMMRPEEQCKPYEFITEEDLNVGDHRSCTTKNGKEKSVQVIKVMEPQKASQLSHELSWYVTLSKEWKDEHKKVWEIFENLDYKLV